MYHQHHNHLSRTVFNQKGFGKGSLKLIIPDVTNFDDVINHLKGPQIDINTIADEVSAYDIDEMMKLANNQDDMEKFIRFIVILNIISRSL